jgi:multicomponent Na+:H+ antiporter subunit A
MNTVAAGEPIRESVPWVAPLSVNFSFYLDGLSLIFAMLVLGVATLVTIYAGGYLKGHHQLGRFYAFLIAFMASMLGLVVADNIVLIFVFWELTSITSFLLIGFGHEREAARKAALRALIVTGLGGLALLAGVVLLGTAAGTWSVSEMIDRGITLSDHPLYVPILVLVFAGCFTKSAQFPFHFWLPGAMEAPAPVSAFLHSSTMVKAGVFLLARLNPILGDSLEWDFTLKLVGSFTMVYAAFVATRQTQFKRILAYTTVSALGALVMLLGLGVPGDAAAMAFLLAHALYKGTLFMFAGCVEKATGVKDVEKLRGLATALPITFAAGALGALSMAGLPPLFGYAGKSLLKDSLETSPYDDWLVIATVVMSAFTVVAALLVGLRPFVGAKNEAAKHAKPNTPALLIGPITLALLGIVAGVFPALFADPLVAAATRAVTGEASTVSLSVIEIFKPGALVGPTGLGIAIGLALYLGIRWWRAATALFSKLDAIEGSRVFDASLAATLAGGKGVTRVVQNGSLNWYLRVCVLGLLGLAGITAAARPDLFTAVYAEPSLEFPAAIFDVVLVVLMIASAIAATLMRRRLSSVAALGVLGTAAALIFVLFGAPDVAMTQFSVETLTVLILVLVFYHLPQFKRFSSPVVRAFDWVISIAFGAFMASAMMLALRMDFGEPISDYFSETAVPEAKGRNIVNVILVDFRATDTFGELVVLAIAGVGVATLLATRPVRRVTSDHTHAHDPASLARTDPVGADPTDAEPADIDAPPHSSRPPNDGGIT